MAIPGPRVRLRDRDRTRLTGCLANFSRMPRVRHGRNKERTNCHTTITTSVLHRVTGDSWEDLKSPKPAPGGDLKIPKSPKELPAAPIAPHPTPWYPMPNRRWPGPADSSDRFLANHSKGLTELAEMGAWWLSSST